MVPEHLLHHRREGSSVRPRFVEESEIGLLEEMIARRERAVDRFQSELEGLLVGEVRIPRRMLVAHVLAHLARPRTEPHPTLVPKRVRAVLFAAGAAARVSRDQALSEAAAELGAPPAELEASLFADLPGERRVAPLPVPLSPEALRWKVNAALLAGFLARSTRVTVRSDADLTPLVRHARGSGLIAARQEGRMVISGPYSLFRHTAIYGRALSHAVGALARVDGAFSIELELALDGRRGVMTVEHTAPVFAGHGAPPDRSGSPAARFATAWKKHAPGWAAILDPAAVESADTRLDADLLLVPPAGGPGHFVEILRFWNAAQVIDRLAQWEAAGASAWFLLDADHDTADAGPPDHPRALVFKRRASPDALGERIASVGGP